MRARVVMLALLCTTLGCAVVEAQRGVRLDPRARWVLLPVVNHAEPPQAGERAEAVLGTILRAQGVADLRVYPAAKDDAGLPELDEQRRYEEALAWARAEGYAYAVTGSVEEWRYRSGLDGEPAVGLTVRVIELQTGRVVWSASGSRSGWGRDTVSGTAQKLMKTLLGQLQLDAGTPWQPNATVGSGKK
jgi:hypothetical protein